MVDNEKKLSMSLDEIIAANRTTRKVQAKPMVEAKTASKRSGKSSRGGKGRGGGKPPAQSFTISVQNAAVKKKPLATRGGRGGGKRGGGRATGGFDAGPRMGPSARGIAAAAALGKTLQPVGSLAQRAALGAEPSKASSRARQERAAALASSQGAVWKHDLFQDHDQGARRARGGGMAPPGFAAAPVAAVPQVDPCKLCVSNLHPDVTNEDMNELFTRIGPLRSASLLYNMNGESEGRAEVVFHDPAHAAQAKDEYHGVQLDGQKMQIEFSVTEVVASDRFANRLGGRVGGRVRGRGVTGGSMRMDMS